MKHCFRLFVGPVDCGRLRDNLGNVYSHTPGFAAAIISEEFPSAIQENASTWTLGNMTIVSEPVLSAKDIEAIHRVRKERKNHDF